MDANMIDYLYQTSDLNLFLIVSGFFILVSIVALFFVRVILPLHLRYQENAVIGCTCALVSVIYGVLSGFATLYLINNNNYASDSVQHETSSIVNLYMDTQGLPDPLKSQVQKDITRYLFQVINVEWAQMSKGEMVSKEGALILGDMLNTITHYNITTTSESVAISDMFSASRNLYDARQQRIQLSYASLSNEVWVVILVGTCLLLGVSYLFGVNFYLHVFIMIVAALMTSSIIFLLIALDKPFQGEFIVGPQMFESVYKVITNT
jgi:hypothetical protein